MTVQTLIESGLFQLRHKGTGLERHIVQPFCCDLLSVAMGKAPESSAWVTVMGNINTLAVAVLTDVACIVLAEGSELDKLAFDKAVSEEITVFQTELSIFQAALEIWQMLEKEANEVCLG